MAAGGLPGGPGPLRPRRWSRTLRPAGLKMRSPCCASTRIGTPPLASTSFETFYPRLASGASCPIDDYAHGGRVRASAVDEHLEQTAIAAAIERDGRGTHRGLARDDVRRRALHRRRRRQLQRMGRRRHGRTLTSRWHTLSDAGLRMPPVVVAPDQPVDRDPARQRADAVQESNKKKPKLRIIMRPQTAASAFGEDSGNGLIWYQNVGGQYPRPTGVVPRFVHHPPTGHQPGAERQLMVFQVGAVGENSVDLVKSVL